MSNHEENIKFFKSIEDRIDKDELNRALSERIVDMAKCDIPACNCGGFHHRFNTREQKISKLKNGSDTAIWAANEIERLEKKLTDINERPLEFAEYMAKKAEQYIEEYGLLEEERLHQTFTGKKDNEKLFQMEQEVGEIATQLKIYIYEFRKRRPTGTRKDLGSIEWREGIL
jgi:hypothetical protein